MDAQGALAPSRTVAAAIIAGGRGTRLGGVDKSALVIDGRTIFERQVDTLSPLFARVFLVANGPGAWTTSGLDIVPDRVPAGSGPLAGVDAALAALQNHETAVVCVACDMPFLDAKTLMALRDRAPDTAALVPRLNQRPEPLLARYARSASAALSAALRGRDLSLHRALLSLNPTWIEEEDLRALDSQLRSFTNLNTVEDLRIAENLLRQFLR